MVVQYKKSGGNAFKNKYQTSDKHPKFTGDLWISSDVIKDLIDYAKENTSAQTLEKLAQIVGKGRVGSAKAEHINKARIQVAMWERTDKNGNPYMYLQLEAVSKDELNLKEKADDENPI